MNKLEHDNIIAFHPGYVIKDILEGEGMSQDELSKRLGTSAKTVSKLINGKIDLTREMAMKLSIVFDTSVTMWLNLNQDYLKKKIEIEKRISQKMQFKTVSQLDYNYWVRLGVVAVSNEVCMQIDELQRYFGVTDLNTMYDRNFLLKISDSAPVSESQILHANAWIQTAMNFAKKANTEIFDYKGLKKKLTALRDMAMSDSREKWNQMKDLLSAHGIAFVLLPTLDHCPVETVVKWLSPDKVLFAMRDNLTNTGKFWTDFFNGIGYIMERRLTLTIATGMAIYGDKKVQAVKIKAEDFSKDFLIPRDDYRIFLESHSFDRKSVDAFAESQRIHPDIVTFRLQNDGVEIPYLTAI